MCSLKLNFTSYIVRETHGINFIPADQHTYNVHRYVIYRPDFYPELVGREAPLPPPTNKYLTLIKLSIIVTVKQRNKQILCGRKMVSKILLKVHPMAP